MPSYDNAELLAQKIADCNSELDALFADLNVSISLKRQLRDIKNFYQRAFDKTSNKKTATTIVNQYEQFIVSASEVKLGQLTAEEANLKINDVTEDRQLNIIMHNIFKVCELFFWAFVAATAYVGCLTIGIPSLFLQPFIGLAVTVGTGVLLGSAIHNMGECMDAFKSFDRVNKEDTQEKDIISFFSRQPLRKLEEMGPDKDLESTYESPTCTVCN